MILVMLSVSGKLFQRNLRQKLRETLKNRYLANKTLWLEQEDLVQNVLRKRPNSGHKYWTTVIGQEISQCKLEQFLW